MVSEKKKRGRQGRVVLRVLLAHTTGARPVSVTGLIFQYYNFPWIGCYALQDYTHHFQLVCLYGRREFMYLWTEPTARRK